MLLKTKEPYVIDMHKIKEMTLLRQKDISELSIAERLMLSEHERDLLENELLFNVPEQ